AARPLRVPGDGAGAGERLVGEREVPVADVVFLAELEHPPRVVDGRLAAADDGVDAGDLPFAAGEVRGAGPGHLPPVEARRVRRVDHAVVVDAGPVVALHEPPGLVEKLRGQQPLVADGPGAGRPCGGRRAALFRVVFCHVRDPSRAPYFTQ